MIIKPKEIEILKEDPFKNDALDRKKYIEILTDFIKISNEALVLAINSPWGTGKSTFVNMWKYNLENQGFLTFHFNAWENDFVNEPFIAFIEAFENILQKHPKISTLKKVSRQIIKSSMPGIVKAATAGIVNINDINLDKDVEDTIIKYSEKIADEQIKNYKNTKNAMISFKKLLSQSIEEKVKENGDKPIIFFVDELDRCRPNFSIELLEKIKHLFYTEGIIFVLSLDKTQLGHSVKAIYGNDMDVNGYLARFIDVEYTLPEVNHEKFIEYLIKKFEFEKFFIDRRKNRDLADDELVFTEICKELFKINNFSLRTQEHIFIRLSLVLHTIQGNYRMYPELMIFLLCLKYSNVELYNRIRNKDIYYTELIESLNEDEKFKEFFNETYGYGPVLKGILIYALKDSKAKEMYRKELDSLNDGKAEDINRKEHIKAILSNIKNYSFRGMSTMLEYILNKIEIADQFTYNN